MPLKALRTILPIAGWSDDRAAAVTFTGGTDPVLPTPFRIGVAGAATVAAAGLAAAALWEVRTGRHQSVTIDLRQATASLRSGTYMKLGDGELPHRRHAIMGCYPTKDGRWSYLHCNFPNHRAAALGVLGVWDRDAVARAVATWNAADLRLFAAKGTGGMVRTRRMGEPSAGRRHPPCHDGDRSHRRQPAKLPAATALRHPCARPHARLLAGRPARAPRRAWRRRDEDHGRAPAQPRLPEWDTGHGSSAQLDLRVPGDVETLVGAGGCFRGLSSTPARPVARGIGLIRPGLVYVSLSAFGHTGRGPRGAASTPWCRRWAA
jgi:hypothetical protein